MKLNDDENLWDQIERFAAEGHEALIMNPRDFSMALLTLGKQADGMRKQIGEFLALMVNDVPLFKDRNCPRGHVFPAPRAAFGPPTK